MWKESSKSRDIYPFTFQGHQDPERLETQASSQSGSQQCEPNTGLQRRSISWFFLYARFPRRSPRRGFSWREIPLALHRWLGQCVRAFCDLAASQQVESTFLDDRGCKVSSQPPKSQKMELKKGWQRRSPAVTCSPLLPLPTWLLPSSLPSLKSAGTSSHQAARAQAARRNIFHSGVQALLRARKSGL